MEKVKIPLLLLFFLITAARPVMDQGNIQEAFRESYTHENNGEIEKAIEALEKVFETSSYELNLRLGWLHYQKGSMEESIGFYNRAVDLKPYAVEPKLGLAYPLSAMGRWNDIIELYEQILKTDPQNSLVNYRMGLIYYNRGQYERADLFIEKVVNLYPFDYDSLLLFAWNKLMLGRKREATVLFNKVLLANPGDESALRGLDMIR